MRLRWSTLAVLLALLLAACASTPGSDSSAAPVMRPDASPANDCERAVVARAQRIRDHDSDGAQQLEADVFARCTYRQFAIANAKMMEAYSYPGEGRTYVGRGCSRLFSIHRGSRLCETR